MVTAGSLSSVVPGWAQPARTTAAASVATLAHNECAWRSLHSLTIAAPSLADSFSSPNSFSFADSFSFVVDTRATPAYTQWSRDCLPPKGGTRRARSRDERDKGVGREGND